MGSKHKDKKEKHKKKVRKASVQLTVVISLYDKLIE